MPPEAESCRHIGAVTERYEGAAQDVRMEPVDGLWGQLISLDFWPQVILYNLYLNIILILTVNKFTSA